MSKEEDQKEKQKEISLESLSIEDLREKFKILERDNDKINEQLFSLQNKFYVQTKILNDKNSELSKEVSNSQKIKSENMKIMKESNEIQSKIKEVTSENQTLKKENEKIKKEIADLSKKYNENNLKQNYLIAQLEEQNSILSNENLSLKESTVKLKNQVDFVSNEMKAKESKIIFSLKNENKENEERLMKEIEHLKQINQSLSMNNLNSNPNLISPKQYEQSQNLFLNNNLATDPNNNNVNVQLSSPFVSKIQVVDYESKNISTLQNLLMNSEEDRKLFEAEVEKRLTTLKSENTELKNKISSLEKAMDFSDKKLKAIKLDLNQSEKTNQNYFLQLQDKEKEITNLNSQITKLKVELDKNVNVENILSELTEKNQTISFLLSQIDSLKTENAQTKTNAEQKLNSISEEKNNLISNIDEAKKSYEDHIINLTQKLSDIQKENEILINDLNAKEAECNELCSAKYALEEKYDSQFKAAENNYQQIETTVQRITDENTVLKSNLLEVSNISTDKMNELNTKIQNSKDKVHSLMTVYENHIKFLKQRFDSILHDLFVITSLKCNQPQELNEKFYSLIKTIQNSLNDINKLAEREAMVESFKSELKSLKNSLKEKNKTIQTQQKEIFELNSILDVKKLQMKLKPIEPEEKNYLESQINLVELIQKFASITELNLKVQTLTADYEKQCTEMKILQEKLQYANEKNSSQEQNIKELNLLLDNKNKDLSKVTKDHKTEMKNLIDEVKRLKENFIPNEKKNEYIQQIEELEFNIKSLKDDINRKKDIINRLKTNLEEKGEAESFIKSNEEEKSALSEKVKTLQKEISKKDALLRDLRKNHDNVKSNETFLKSENENLVEKNKIHKIDIQRKECIIKELKDKINNYANKDELKDKKAKKDNIQQQAIQKLKSENERKDNYITTLKTKNEALEIELNQLKSISQKISKNNTDDLQRELKSHTQTKNKLETYYINLEQTYSCLRRICKDLLSSYEREKLNSDHQNLTNSIKEGMNILGVNMTEAGEFLNDENYNECNEFKNKMLRQIDDEFNIENTNFNSEDALLLYNELKDKLNQLQFENMNNLNVNYNFSRKSIPFTRNESEGSSQFKVPSHIKNSSYSNIDNLSNYSNKGLPLCTKSSSLSNITQSRDTTTTNTKNKNNSTINKKNVEKNQFK